MFQKGDFSQIDEKVFKEVFRELPHSKCDMAIVSASLFQASGVQNIGRSFIYFTSLKLMHSYWKEQELAQQVAFMPCLIALIKADNFDEAINFVDLVGKLPGNAVKSTKNRLIRLNPFRNKNTTSKRKTVQEFKQLTWNTRPIKEIKS